MPLGVFSRALALPILFDTTKALHPYSITMKINGRTFIISGG